MPKKAKSAIAAKRSSKNKSSNASSVIKTEGVKTVEIINGVTEFFFVIPCEPAGKPDRLSPIHRVKENQWGSPVSSEWECRGCGRIFHSLHGWKNHCGIDVMLNKISDGCNGI